MIEFALGSLDNLLFLCMLMASLALNEFLLNVVFTCKRQRFQFNPNELAHSLTLLCVRQSSVLRMNEITWLE